MKNLYMIGGTMGVGKSTVSRQLSHELQNCVFLDGDWCWDSHPFQVTEETKKMVMENITFLLNNFLHCSAYQNIVFCWVLHEQSILDEILSAIDTDNLKIHSISLLVSKEELSHRIQKDISAGFRSKDVLERSINVCLSITL